MNREDVAMDVTVQNVEILRGRLEKTEHYLAYFVENEENHDENLAQRHMMHEEARQFLASQQGERNQCDGCQAGIPLIDGAHRMGRPDGYPDLMSCQKERYEHPEQAEGAQGERDEDGDTIINRLRLSGLSIDGDNAYKRDLLDCVVGALAFGFQGRPAPDESHWLLRFWEIGNAEREARAALAQPSPKSEPRLVECGGCVEACMKTPEHPLVRCLRENGEAIADAAIERQRASMASELELELEPERPDITTKHGYPAYSVAQHDRIVGALRRQVSALALGAEQAMEQRDAAPARVAELEKQEPALWFWLERGDETNDFARRARYTAKRPTNMQADLGMTPYYTAPVAQAGQVPEVSGIARAYDHPRAIVLYLRKEPTDDDMRAIQEGLRMLTKQSSNPAPEPVTCPRCQGDGTIWTGIDESPSTICNRCDGTGSLAAAPAQGD